MLKTIENQLIKEAQVKQIKTNDSDALVCHFDYEYFQKNAEIIGFPPEYIPDVVGYRPIGLLNMEQGNLLFSLQVPHEVNTKDSFSHIYIYFRKNMLVFICKKHKIVEQLITDINKGLLENESIEKILFVFFDQLICDDGTVFEEMEKQITAIEESLIYSKKQDYVKEIFVFRKKLMLLKKYYQQMSDIMDDLYQSETVSIANKRYLKRLSDKSKRLYADVLHLRDYVTQIREAYQTQMDINLNSIMKLFTVIAAIFMPLTVLVGWYGMNLKMPEFGWNFGYPFVIAISLVIVIAEIVYFAKNKWF